MTNEELAVRIKSGESELIDELWAQSEKLIMHHAWKFYRQYTDRCDAVGVTVDDLYQAGFFSLLKAVIAYDETSGYKFLTYLNYPLQNQFNDLAKQRSAKQLKDPGYMAESLDSPVGSDSENITLLLDTIVDESSQDGFDNFIENDYNTCLRNALDSAIASLPEKQAILITKSYFNDIDQNDLVKYLGVSGPAVYQIKRDAFKVITQTQRIAGIPPNHHITIRPER